MRYKIFIKKIGTNSITEIPSIPSEEIRSFCSVGSDIYLIYKDGIALIKDGEVINRWHYNLSTSGNFSDFSSCFYSEEDCSIYIVGEHGCQIYKIDLNLMSLDKLICGDTFLKKYMCKNSNTSICVNGGAIYWTVQNLHRCFSIKGNEPFSAIGCGKPGFSITSPSCCKISSPSGVTCIKNIICISELGNNCIRGIDKNSIFYLLSDIKKPKNLIFKKNKLFFLSENKIKMLSTEGNTSHVYEIYSSKKNIFSFCTQSDNNIVILESNHEYRDTN